MNLTQASLGVFMAAAFTLATGSRPDASPGLAQPLTVYLTPQIRVPDGCTSVPICRLDSFAVGILLMDKITAGYEKRYIPIVWQRSASHLFDGQTLTGPTGDRDSDLFRTLPLSPLPYITDDMWEEKKAFGSSLFTPET